MVGEDILCLVKRNTNWGRRGKRELDKQDTVVRMAER